MSMIIPPLKTTIERRLLINYRIDPDIIEPYLPDDPAITPRLINGYAIAGICLIRLTNLRPALIGPHIGLTAENAAHRIGINHANPDGTKTPAVWIPERHTTSHLAKLAGGIIFPGKHHHATFTTDEHDGTYHIHMDSPGNTIDVTAHKTHQWASTIFNTPEEASDYFKDAPIGYSPRPNSDKTDAIELITPHWATTPVSIDSLTSTFYDAFPKDSIQLDDALIMENIESEWAKPKPHPALAAITPTSPRQIFANTSQNN